MPSKSVSTGCFLRLAQRDLPDAGCSARDIEGAVPVGQALRRATRIVGLQECALGEVEHLDAAFRAKSHIEAPRFVKGQSKGLLSRCGEINQST